MQVIKAYPAQVKEWKHLPKEEFTETLEEPAETYLLEITPPEPADNGLMYFNVTIEKKVKSIPRHKELFSAILYYHFKVETNNQVPTAEFYFSIIETAAVNFAVYFYENIKKTNLKGHKIKKPTIELLRADIQKAIDTWTRQYQCIS